MRRFVWLLLISNLSITLYSYAADYVYRGDFNIDSVISEKVSREDVEKSRDFKIMRNFLDDASKDDYDSFNDIVANYPGAEVFFSEALYDAEITEIEILDEKGVAYIGFALMKLEDKLMYQKRESDSNKLTMLISSNSSNGCISCMDLGVVIMQYVISE
ncbi:MAG: hypothetical protein P9X27_01425 [Candidatus Kaelpia aquatica]|nr:hypothetical protein [Candidatus Kaelpia aquatica]